ncbi:hypothetical protein [Roseovarius indicus]|jgi:hypothetical protein|nr:hypothetical protein [Roseovarius indicus]
MSISLHSGAPRAWGCGEPIVNLPQAHFPNYDIGRIASDVSRDFACRVAG